ncbi:MAG: beta strand repeat-containing protein, partial [Verrucomicrobium sp.]
MLRSLQSSSVRLAALRLGFSSAFYLVLLASSALRSGAFAQTTWLNVNQASFADPNNWSSSAPSFTNAAVIDYHNILNPVPGTVHTLTVLQAIGLGDLTLGDLAVTDPDAYRIVGAAITFGKTGGSALVKQGLARDVIASAINLGSPLNVNVAAGSGGLDLQGNIGIGTVTKLGGGTLVLSGTGNNSINLLNAQQGVLELAKASSLTVKAVTTVLNVGGSTSADTATVKIGGTYVGLGATHLSNYRDQISNNAVVTLNAFGTLDLNGNSEGLSQLLGTGKVTNSVVDTVSTLLVGEASAVNIVFGGVIEDGIGKVSLVKASGVSLSLTAANTFTGRVAVANGVLSLTGTGGSIATLAIDVNRGTLLLDNLTNHSSQNRINDAATVTLSEGGVMIIRRSTAGDTSETIGTLAVANGHNIIRFDHSSGSSAAGILANSITLQITDYTRSVGGTVGFAEAATAAAPAGNNYFSSTAPAAATTLSKIILTNLPSNWLVGGDASTAFNRKVLIGAFGNLLENSVSNRVGTRLMTVENVGGINYIRPLDTSEFREIGGGAVNRIITGSNLIGGSPASGPTDNVKITGVTGAAASPLTIKMQAVNNQLAGHIAFNSWWIEAPVSASVVASNNIRIAENNIVHLGDYAGDDLHAATTGGSGTIFINGGLATTAGGPGYGTVYLRGGTIDFGSREGIFYLDVTNGAHIYSTLTGSGGMTKTGNGQAHYYGWNTYSGVSTLAANELWFYTDTALGQNGAGNGMINYGSFLMNNGINVGSLTDDTQQKELVMKGGVFYAAGSKSNSWNGDILLDNINDAGEYSPLTFNVRTNANMIINGDVTGIGAPSPVLNSVLESGRTLNIINESVASVRGTSGIFHLTGILSDYEGRAALENYEKLQLRIAAYTTGATSVSRNKFNVFIDDARNTNPYLDFYSGYLHLKNGMGVDNTSFTVTAFRQTDNSTVFDRSNNITALLLGDAGSAFRTASFTYGRNIGAQYSSNSVALIGGENTSGTVTFGNSNGGTTFAFTVSGTAATKNKATNWTNLFETRSATTISGDAAIAVDSLSGIKVGMLVTGAGIPTGTRVARIFNGQIYLSNNATAAGSGVALSFYDLTNTITLDNVTG